MWRAAAGLTRTVCGTSGVLASACASTAPALAAADAGRAVGVTARLFASSSGSADGGGPAAARGNGGGAGGPGAGATSAGHSATQAKLFQKVLDGDFKPPEEAVKAEASASGKAPSTAVRLLSFIGNTVFYGGLLGGAGFFASTYAYTDDDVRRIRNEAKQQRGHGAVASAKFEALDRFLDAREWYTERVKGFTEPGSDTLLPDLLPFQKQARMRTLVLDLDGVLVQSVWQRKHGWKTVKRPGVGPFLEEMAKYYELVVFTNRSHSYADPILNSIDPGIQSNQGPMVMYRLYKNSTQWRNNENIRDLTKLNRDLPNVIYLVTESKAGTVEPSDNVLVLPDYKPGGSDGGGSTQDTTLLDIVPLLELIWKQDVQDARAVCRSYHGKNVVEEFRRRDRAPVVRQPTAAPARRRFGFG